MIGRTIAAPSINTSGAAHAMAILKTNTFKHAIGAGRQQVGIWNSLCSNIAAEAIAASGYDWALLDMEHSANDLRTVLGQLQAYEDSPTIPVVRPIWNDPVIVKSLLDMGAPGLLFPMIQSVEEAQAAVAATRYPPRGKRGVSMSQRGNRFGRVTDYFDRVEEETCIIVQIETREALSRVGEIARVDGVDGVFFGPADLAADMGLLGQVANEGLWADIVDGAQIARAAGKPAGTLVGDPAKALELFDAGFAFVACGSDVNLMVKSADAQLKTMRDALG